MPRHPRVAEEVKVETEVQEAPDETTALLLQAAEQLAAAAAVRGDRSKVLKDVEATLSKIRVGDMPELADSPVVQAFLKAIGVSDLKPGETKNRGTLAHREREWSWDDAWREFEHVKFMPAVTVPITWNGVGPVQLVMGDEITLPTPFYDIYREHMYALKQKDRNINWLMAKSDLPPDPNWITDTSARIRAESATKSPTGSGVAGYYQPGAGMINMGEEGAPVGAPSESAVKEG